MLEIELIVSQHGHMALEVAKMAMKPLPVPLQKN